MTRPIDAYYDGVEARINTPDLLKKRSFIPYSGLLAEAWLDGWNDAGGQYIYTLKDGKRTGKVPISETIGKFGGVCPDCWSFAGLTDLPDGVIRCRYSPCREENYASIDEEKVPVFLATLNAGAYI